METSDIITVQDLWSAGVTETPLPGALVGSPALMIMCISKIWRIYPCFACFHFPSSITPCQTKIANFATGENSYFQVGPTFSCIIGRQFHNIRFGDRSWKDLIRCLETIFSPDFSTRNFFCRFFYENGGWPSSFTLEQLEQIRRFSLARLLCDNTDQIETIQVHPNLNHSLIFYRRTPPPPQSCMVADF